MNPRGIPANPADEVAPQRHDPYLAALVAGQPRHARAVIEGLVGDGIPAATILVDVLAPAMRSIGELWQAGSVTVAQEHLASAITEAQLAWLAALLPTRPLSSSRIVLAGSPGELHSIGLQMLADILAADGWQVLHLGASVPADDLLDLVRRRQPQAVGLSTALTTHLRDARDIAARLHALPAAPVVLLGGPAYDGNAALARQLGADFFATDAVLAAEMLQPILNLGRRYGTPMSDTHITADAGAASRQSRVEPASRADEVGVARLAEDGRIVSANAAFARLAGRPPAGALLEQLVAVTQLALVRELVAGAGSTWTEAFLGFVHDDAMVPIDRAAHVGRFGGEIVVVVEAVAAEAGIVNQGLLTLVHDLVETQRLLELKSSALETAVETVRSTRLMLRKLQGILPSCMGCGRVRSDDDREWLEISDYITRTGAIALSHGYCPRCAAPGSD